MDLADLDRTAQVGRDPGDIGLASVQTDDLTFRISDHQLALLNAPADIHDGAHAGKVALSMIKMVVAI